MTHESSGRPESTGPTPASIGDQKVLDRRSFLNRAMLGLIGLAGAIVGLPIVAYLLSPIIRPARDLWRDLGTLDKFKIGETVQAAIEEPSPLPWAGDTSQTSVWVRRTDTTSFTVFSVNCTHLGCPVRWRPEANLFLCPCHGGVYYPDGRVAAGPPPQPLHQYEVRIAGDHVQILTLPIPVV